MRRLDKGAPIRAAMKAAELDIPRLAAKTREVDPTGEGLSKSMVGFIVGGGKSAREECSDRAADLIAAALDQEVLHLFEPTFIMLPESTSTRRPKTRTVVSPLPQQLMDQQSLARFLRKSTSWIDRQIRLAQAEERTWPGLIYVGRSRRFDPLAVLDGLRKQRAA
ncbi:hypothetical protein [Streptomyces huasconensis]|uniref:hypothetical protein n=1 Tax=Streptomyces huasconensis TaxID=1854574 RepID=UPI003701527C